MPWYLVRRFWTGFEEVMVEAENEEWAVAKTMHHTPRYETLDVDAFMGTLVRHTNRAYEMPDYVPPGTGIAEEFDTMTEEEFRRKYLGEGK